MASPIFKIVSAQAWSDAAATGVFSGADVDRRDGYIHLSAAHQVRETAARHFAGQTGLLLVAFDSGALGDALKWETSRGGDRFPHLYGPLRTDLALSVRELPLGPDGRHVFPADVP